jgi:hypothetical protein
MDKERDLLLNASSMNVLDLGDVKGKLDELLSVVHYLQSTNCVGEITDEQADRILAFILQLLIAIAMLTAIATDANDNVSNAIEIVNISSGLALGFAQLFEGGRLRLRAVIRNAPETFREYWANPANVVQDSDIEQGINALPPNPPPLLEFNGETCNLVDELITELNYEYSKNKSDLPEELTRNYLNYGFSVYETTINAFKKLTNNEYYLVPLTKMFCE